MSSADPTRLTDHRPLPCPVHGRRCDGHWCPDARRRVAELLDADIPTWEPSALMRPNADADGVLHNIDLGLIGGYAESLPDLPTDEQIDRSIRRAQQIPTLRLLDAIREVGDDE